MSFGYNSMIDNDQRGKSVKALSEALKTNTTLTKLNLSCEGKRKKTHK